MDRLHALVERYYNEMSIRVQALEVLDIQGRCDPDWMSADDTESLATIRERPPDLRNGESIEGESVSFDFSDELQRSRVYRRNRAFRQSVISVFSNSVHSLGWSFLSELSMAEVSNISAINLAITEGEIFNPQRSSQTWSAEPYGGQSTDAYGIGQRTQLFKIARKAAPANISPSPREQRSASNQIQQPSQPRFSPPPQFEDRYSGDSRSCRRSELHFGERDSAKTSDDTEPTSTLSPTDSLDPAPTSQTQTFSSSRYYDPAEDEPDYHCKGCGKMLEEGKVFRLGKPYSFFIRCRRLIQCR